MAATGDPLMVVASLANPGGNITGLSGIGIATGPTELNPHVAAVSLALCFATNNANVGGRTIAMGEQAVNVRGLGVVRSLERESSRYLLTEN
jgi:Cu/Ag efflux pump CusA